MRAFVRWFGGVGGWAGRGRGGTGDKNKEEGDCVGLRLHDFACTGGAGSFPWPPFAFNLPLLPSRCLPDLRGRQVSAHVLRVESPPSRRLEHSTHIAPRGAMATEKQEPPKDQRPLDDIDLQLLATYVSPSLAPSAGPLSCAFLTDELSTLCPLSLSPYTRRDTALTTSRSSSSRRTSRMSSPRSPTSSVRRSVRWRGRRSCELAGRLCLCPGPGPRHDFVSREHVVLAPSAHVLLRPAALSGAR